MKFDYVLEMYRDNKILKEDVLVIFRANMKRLEKKYEEELHNQVSKLALNLVEKGVIARCEIDHIQSSFFTNQSHK